MRLDLFVLLEAFDERDIELAHRVIETFGYKTGAWAGRPNVEVLVGVNCRDLTTLQVVPGRLEQLAPLLADRGAACRGERRQRPPKARAASRRRATTSRWSAAR